MINTRVQSTIALIQQALKGNTMNSSGLTLEWTIKEFWSSEATFLAKDKGGLISKCFSLQLKSPKKGAK